MFLLFWDASALAKRYFGEMGSDTVNALFAALAPSSMASTPWGYIETYSILRRRLNEGAVDAASFSASVTALQNEVVINPDFLLLTINDGVIFSSVTMIDQHNLNSTDAALLTTLMEFAATPGAPKCVVVSADKRLLRAADNEGFLTINPEAFPAADVPAFLATL